MPHRAGSGRPHSLLEGDRLGGTVAVHVDGAVHDHGRIIRLRLLLLVRQRTAQRPYYCAPLIVGLALEDGERGALGIAENGDLARREIQGPASTTPPSSRAFSMAASRESTVK